MKTMIKRWNDNRESKTYIELEEISSAWNGKVCIIGAGLIGRTWGYDILRIAGFGIDCYYDNNIKENIEIREGIKTISFETVLEEKENMLFCVTVNEKIQDAIERQLIQNGINNYILLGYIFFQQVLESILSKNDLEVINKYKKVVDDEEFIKRQFYYCCGYELNLRCPVTFNEKLQWLKLNNHNPKYTLLVDKYEFKKYIEKEIGNEFVVPTLKVWDKVEDIEFERLPNQFVLKCTHDSGSVILCKDKKNFDFTKAYRQLEKALKRNYYWVTREWPYKNVKPRIIMEKYMEDSNNPEIIDYKLMCFNGVFKVAFTCTERFSKSGLKVTFFDREWRRMDIERHYPSSKQEIKKPKNYDAMIEVAEKLAKNITFARIDFYEIDNRLYVGELTLFPGGGIEEFASWQQDKLLGDYLAL